MGNTYLTEYCGDDGKRYAGPNVRAVTRKGAQLKIDLLKQRFDELKIQWPFNDLEMMGQLIAEIPAKDD